MTADWSPLWSSFRVAGAGVFAAAAPGAWLGWALARREFRGRPFVAAAAALPQALPPLILSTYLLLAAAGAEKRFTWPIAALAAALSAFPGLTRAARAAFEALGRDHDCAARSLGSSDRRVFCLVEAPLVCRPVTRRAALSFSALAAEYAVTLLVAASPAVRTAMLTGPLLPAAGVTALAVLYLAARLEPKGGRA